MSFGFLPAVDRNILWRYASICFNSDKPLSPTRFGQAIELLQRLSLIDQERFFEDIASIDVVMHGLTRHLLKERVVGDELALIAARLGLVILSYLDEDKGLQRLNGATQLMQAPRVVEGMNALFFMVALGGQVLILDDPPGAVERLALAPNVRQTFEKLVVQCILIEKKAWDCGCFPSIFIEWAQAHMQSLGPVGQGTSE